jgi:hypothetical protein
MICAADKAALDASMEHLLKLKQKMTAVSSLIAANIESGVSLGKHGGGKDD